MDLILLLAEAAGAPVVAVVVTATLGRVAWVWLMTPFLPWEPRMLQISSDARRHWVPAGVVVLLSVEVRV